MQVRSTKRADLSATLGKRGEGFGVLLMTLPSMMLHQCSLEHEPLRPKAEASQLSAVSAPSLCIAQGAGCEDTGASI